MATRASTAARATSSARAKKAHLPGSRLPLRKQLLYQLLCLFIAFTVLFPIAWVLSISISPLNISHPTDFIPKNATLDAYSKVISSPTANKNPGRNFRLLLATGFQQFQIGLWYGLFLGFSGS